MYASRRWHPAGTVTLTVRAGDESISSMSAWANLFNGGEPPPPAEPLSAPPPVRVPPPLRAHAEAAAGRADDEARSASELQRSAADWRAANVVPSLEPPRPPI